MHQKRQDTLGNESGFSLLEILVVVAIMGTVAAMAIMVSPSFTQHARAESGIAQATDALRLARETAISQRRNVLMQFVGLTAIRTVRQDIGANGVVTGTTVLNTVEFENRVQFRLQPGVPNTPDGFPVNGTATAFGASPTRMFTSEGTFVDQQGDPLNGTLFLSVPGDPTSARAITIFGPTALIRAWRWNGQEWVE
jgi:prepilin-type N-terminal cleavage/methylation domain-containing protein